MEYLVSEEGQRIGVGQGMNWMLTLKKDKFKWFDCLDIWLLIVSNTRQR